MNKTILVLGGYGSTGRPLCDLLLQETDVTVVVAGRNVANGKALVAELEGKFGGGRATAVTVDAASHSSLEAAFAGVDMVVVASSTVQYTEQVARACLAAGVDYFDVNFSEEKTAVLRQLAPEIEAAGLCFVTDGGFHPGVPAALVRYAGSRFDQLQQANVASVIKIDWRHYDVGVDTAEEMAGEFMGMDSSYYRNGRWHKSPMMGMGGLLTLDYGEPFGKQYAVPMGLAEMRRLPELIPSLQDTGFFVGGFNWFTDWLIMPIVAVGVKIHVGWKRPLGRLLLWSLHTFSRPPYGTVLRLEARGKRAGSAYSLDLQLTHEDGYVFTAIPAVACLLQLVDGTVRQPGLHWQALIVEPTRFLADMARMGIDIQENETMVEAVMNPI
ncbi:MAG: saccharopine dehydrogenase NADP-binding domain-containing protein [Anaerolineae bacterium]|nr:saccharopine dehydrogenase NADP-binding domain-containing protein [Anaerolineae bacterium]